MRRFFQVQCQPKVCRRKADTTLSLARVMTHLNFEMIFCVAHSVVTVPLIYLAAI